MMANLRQLANVNVTTLRTFRQNFTSEHTVAYAMAADACKQNIGLEIGTHFG